MQFNTKRSRIKSEEAFPVTINPISPDFTNVPSGALTSTSISES